jgi:hypothetical protein
MLRLFFLGRGGRGRETHHFGMKAQSSFATFLLCLPFSLGLIFCDGKRKEKEESRKQQKGC